MSTDPVADQLNALVTLVSDLKARMDGMEKAFQSDRKGKSKEPASSSPAVKAGSKSDSSSPSSENKDPDGASGDRTDRQDDDDVEESEDLIQGSSTSYNSPYTWNYEGFASDVDLVRKRVSDVDVPDFATRFDAIKGNVPAEYRHVVQVLRDMHDALRTVWRVHLDANAGQAKPELLTVALLEVSRTIAHHRDFVLAVSHNGPEVAKAVFDNSNRFISDTGLSARLAVVSEALSRQKTIQALEASAKQSNAVLSMLQKRSNKWADSQRGGKGGRKGGRGGNAANTSQNTSQGRYGKKVGAAASNNGAIHGSSTDGANQ